MKKESAESVTLEQKKVSSEFEVQGVDSVDKIRDILFGNQMRDFDRKFELFEKHISNDLDRLRQENNLQIESLQNYVESEFEILSSKLALEEKNRIEEQDDLDASINRNVKQIDKKISDVSNAIESQSREVNQKVLKLSQDFSSELKNQIEVTRQRLDDFKQDLSCGKVDKVVLAEALNAIALQINSSD